MVIIPPQAVFRHVQDGGRARRQWVATGLDPVSVILRRTIGTDYAALKDNQLILAYDSSLQSSYVDTALLHGHTA